MTAPMHPTVRRALAVLFAALWAGASSACSSTSTEPPSAEPVVYNVVSINGIPLPAPIDVTSGLDENGDPIRLEIIVLSSQLILRPDGIHLGEGKVEQRRNGVTFEVIEWGPLVGGSFRWAGDTLLAVLDSVPPLPDGAAVVGGTGPGGTVRHAPVIAGSRERLWSSSGGQISIHERAG